MAECKDCIHYCVCSPYTAPNESYPEVGGCKLFQNIADVAPKSEVAREIFEEIGKILKEHTTEQHYKGERFVTKTIDIGIERAIAELKKKYTEGEND